MAGAKPGIARRADPGQAEAGALDLEHRRTKAIHSFEASPTFCRRTVLKQLGNPTLPQGHHRAEPKRPSTRLAQLHLGCLAPS